MFGTKLPDPSRYPDNRNQAAWARRARSGRLRRKPSQPKPDGRTRTDRPEQDKRTHFFSSFNLPPPLSLSLSPRPRDAVGSTRTSARTPTLPPPRLAGDGWLRQLGRHRLEPNRGTPYARLPSPPPRLLLPSLARAQPPPLVLPALARACLRASLRVPLVWLGETGLGLGILFDRWVVVGTRLGARSHGATATSAYQALPLPAAQHAWAGPVLELRARVSFRLVFAISVLMRAAVSRFQGSEAAEVGPGRQGEHGRLPPRGRGGARSGNLNF